MVCNNAAHREAAPFTTVYITMLPTVCLTFHHAGLHVPWLDVCICGHGITCVCVRVRVRVEGKEGCVEGELCGRRAARCFANWYLIV